jgi:hypothetical protein
MQNIDIFLVLSVVNLLFGTLSFIIATIALIKVIAAEKATHTVQLMPVDEEIDRANQEFLNQWATSEEAAAKEQRMYNEELEAEMPEFALSDIDKEKFSL